MSEGEISLAVSAIGLVLGLIGAYGRLKLMFRAMSSFGSTAANRYWDREIRQVGLFVQSPSAAGAHLGLLAIHLGLVMSAAALLWAVLTALPGPSGWYPRAVMWLAAAWLGLKLGMAVGTLEAVKKCSAEGGDALATLIKQHPKA